jgi:outer membrane lipoprotein-sorting protein
MTALIALAGISLVGIADPDIDDIVQKNFRDAQLSGKFDFVNQKELAKINKDFGTQYRVKSTQVWLKDPHKLRIEAKVQDTSLLYIYNGAVRYFRVPRSNINMKEDNSRAPGKRQTLLDFGVLTASLFSDPFSAKYVRTDRASGDYVFDLTYARPKYDDDARHRIWVDPAKRIVTKREWYNQSGRQMATFLYENPVSFGSVWVPTKVTVKNVEGKVGAVTIYENIKVNTGLADSLFSFK